MSNLLKMFHHIEVRDTKTQRQKPQFLVENSYRKKIAKTTKTDKKD